MGPQFSHLNMTSYAMGTPGRVMDHVEKRRIDLSNVKLRVLDKADRMLDMGFEDDLRIIFGQTPKQVPTCYFLQPLPEQIERVAKQYLHNPVTCKVEAQEGKPAITQLGYNVLPHTAMRQALKAVLTHYQPKNAIVFCNRKAQVNEVVEELIEDGFSAAGLQGDMEQHQRTSVLMQFASDALQVLVATDVAARGLDIDDVACVINYTVSERAGNSYSPHWSYGTCGRSRHGGNASHDDEEHFLRKIEVLQESDIPLKKGAQKPAFS